jgi:hypothetical protein
MYEAACPQRARRDMTVDEWQLTAEQRARALALIESLPWGDIDGHLVAMEEALRVAMDATAVDFELWEREGELRFVDEFSVTPDELEEMTDEWKLALVARLLRTVAMMYGVTTDYVPGQPNVGQEDWYTPAALLRGLNDIVEFPT